MMRPYRLLHLALLGFALAWAPPAPAQSFEGLDLGAPARTRGKKKKAPKTKAKKGTRRASSQRGEPERAAPAAQAPATAAAALSPAAAPATPPPAAAPAPAPAAAVAPAPAAGSLDLSAAPEAAPATRPAKAAGKALSFDSVDVSGKSADRQKLDTAVSFFKKDEYERAAMAAHEVLGHPKLAEHHLEAQYLLAKSLYRMGLYHSSLEEFSRILSRGPQTRFFKTSLEWLFFISRKTKNETVILDEIARYANQDFPEKFRHEFRYLLARYHFVRGRALDQVGQGGEADKSFEEVKRLALQVSRASPFYARAKYLEGLAYFREGGRQPDAAARRSDPRFRAAIEAMKEVVRLTRPGSVSSAALAAAGLEGAGQDMNLRELAFMQLARTHYGMQQNRYAIFYYGKVGRGNREWLDSLFEASWANYRVGQYEQALGNLITLSSPFFREEYYPEALILKAVIYYENCRYRESSAILEDFERTYLPVHDELERLLRKRMDASGYYDVLAEVQKKNHAAADKGATDVILERILRLALTDQDLSKTNDSILELEAEMDAFGQKSDTFRYSDLTKRLLEGLKRHRRGLVDKAGIMAKGKLETELGALKQLLANGLRIKFETTSKEKDFLEEQLRAGGRTAILKDYRYSVAVADDQLYWPYEGEFWRDELGTYQYTLTKGCVERDTANRRVKDAL